MGGAVLVTGVAGFVGSHLAEALLARGETVRGLDRFDETLYPATAKRRNAEALRARGDGNRFHLVEGDIRDPDAVRRALEGCDRVCHLAAVAGVRKSLENPQHYVDINIRGTLVLLDAMASRGVGRLAFASSSSVYGASSRPPFREDEPADRPESPYGATKRAGELFCHVHHRLRGTACACLRFFTVYGPRQRPDMAIASFLDKADRGEALPIYGDGEAIRDFTYVSDIVDGIVRAIDRTEGYEIFNLGAGRPTRLLDLVAAIGRALGKTPTLAYLPPQKGDVPLTFADVAKARRLLGYDPKVDIEEGLRRFVAWRRSGGA